MIIPTINIMNIAIGLIVYIKKAIDNGTADNTPPHISEMSCHLRPTLAQPGNLKIALKLNQAKGRHVGMIINDTRNNTITAYSKFEELYTLVLLSSILRCIGHGIHNQT